MHLTFAENGFLRVSFEHVDDAHWPGKEAVEEDPAGATCCDMLRHAATRVSVEPVLVPGDRKTTRQAFLVANLGEQNAGSCTQPSDLSTKHLCIYCVK